MAALPTGTVTFLFTDIEGSTELWERHPDGMPEALARHDALLRGAIEERGGAVFKTVGDAFHAVFPGAPEAVDAAVAGQRALVLEAWEIPAGPKVRMALHSGSAELRGEDYFGPALNRVSRILAAGHGGQILLSQAVERLVSDRFPEGTALRDMGERRLKDLTEPERIFQLVAAGLPTEFPPLVTLDERPHNIPAQLTPLVGREREVAAVRKRLLDPDTRLVTLLGPGGTGKTRLALQAAAEVIDAFRDGAFLVNLAPVHDPALVAGEILATLDVRPEGEEQEVEVLKRHLARRQLLLILDNFEQVVEAAPMVGGLLGAAPGVTALVTSQAALRIRGEHEIPVPPLDEEEAVTLFVQRAQEASPRFRPGPEDLAEVGRIADLVDGLPLALELAAARIKMFPPAAIRRRLESGFDFLAGRGRDAPDRHRAMRAALDWSYDLLEEDEKALFRRQAVFDGGFTLESAEAVCSAPDAPLDVLEGLVSLVDKSLIQQEERGGEPRFMRLRTIRAYAVERLETSGEAARWRRRHAEHFADLADRVATSSVEGEAGIGRERLEAELENLRAGMEWALETGAASLAVRYCSALPAVWFLTGLLEESRRWLDATLAMDDALAPRERALCLNLLGRHGQIQGDNSPPVVARFEESLAIYREAGDSSGAARALLNLGNVHRRAERLDAAEEHFRESLDAYRELGDPYGATMALLNLGDVADARGDLDVAEALFEEARDTARAAGSEMGLAWALEYLGTMACQRGLVDEAERLFRQCRELFGRLGSQPGLAYSDYHLGSVARHRGDLEEARAGLVRSLERFRRLEYRPGIAAATLGFAAVDALEGRCERAARLLGFARRLHEEALTSLGAMETDAIDLVVGTCRQGLGEEAYAAALADGAALAVPEATDLALAADDVPRTTPAA